MKPGQHREPSSQWLATCLVEARRRFGPKVALGPGQPENHLGFGLAWFSFPLIGASATPLTNVTHARQALCIPWIGRPAHQQLAPPWGLRLA